MLAHSYERGMEAGCPRDWMIYNPMREWEFTFLVFLFQFPGQGQDLILCLAAIPGKEPEFVEAEVFAELHVEDKPVSGAEPVKVPLGRLSPRESTRMAFEARSR